MKVAILFSGTGSNMRMLVDCHGQDQVEIGMLVSNRPEAAGLEFARSTNIPVRIFDHRLFDDRRMHEKWISTVLRHHDIELICLAGYMRVLTEAFIAEWRGKIINIHPSLLPGLPGLHTHQRAIDLGVKLHGCTVHYVTERVDDGPILGQAAVPVLPDDTADTLAARVLKQEHILYPTVLREICSGKLADHPDSGVTLHNPMID
jgi:phosphoribosylglycinamide formyltransferase-1